MTFAVLYLAWALSPALDFAFFTQDFCFPDLFAVAQEHREISKRVAFFFFRQNDVIQDNDWSFCGLLKIFF